MSSPNYKSNCRSAPEFPEHNPQSGFGMTLIAITIAIVMGISVAAYMRQVSTQDLQFQNSYAASQAYWAALSGIEYGLYKSELGEANVTGTYTFFNASISMDTLETYTDGSALPDFWYAVTSQGVVGSAQRDLRILTKKSLKTIWGDVSIIEGTGNFKIRNGCTLNDSLYIGQNVAVQAGTAIGDPPGEPTHLYIPPGKSVTGGQEDANFTSGAHPQGWLFNPDFNTDPYDSLLDIANAITVTSGNKFKRNKRFKNVVIDLNTYADSTIYVKGNLKLQGCTVTGGDTTRPAVVVATKDIVCENRSGTETTLGDNIVFIAGDDIRTYDHSEFGVDYSALSPENRPHTFNLMYAYDYLFIDNNVDVWSQIFATDDIRLDGSAHGIMYAPDKFTFRTNASKLEGAVFIHKCVGNGGVNRLDHGSMNLNHYFNEDYFKTYDYGVINNSLLEF